RILVSLETLAGSPRGAAELGTFVEWIVGDDEKDLLEGLDLVMALTRDAARLACGRSDILHADLANRVGKLADAPGADRAAQIVSYIDRLRGDLRLNLNKTLVAETILAAVAGAPIAPTT